MARFIRLDKAWSYKDGSTVQEAYINVDVIHVIEVVAGEVVMIL